MYPAIISPKLTNFKYTDRVNKGPIMKHYRQLSISMIILMAGIFLITGLVFPTSLVEGKRQSQSTTTMCNDETGACSTIICTEGQPCQTSHSPPIGTIMPPPAESGTQLPVKEQQPVAQQPPIEELHPLEDVQSFEEQSEEAEDGEEHIVGEESEEDTSLLAELMDLHFD
jgi:hypothetical protein